MSDAPPKPTNKYMKCNVIGGLVIMCIGGALLAISGYNFMLSASYSHDIYQEYCDFNGCKPLEEITREAAISPGVTGAVLTSVGLFFMLYGFLRK